MANSVWVTLAPFAGAPANNTGAPPYAFSGDPTTGLASSAVGTLDFVTAGVSRVSILAGQMNTSVTITSTSYIIATLGLFPAGGSKTGMQSPADGQLNILPSALTTGVGFDVNTNSVLKVRTIAQTGYATVDALGYKVSGVAGLASFGPAVVNSLTVVNGLVTAAS